MKREKFIQQEMKKRQATSTGGKNPQLMTKWSEAEQDHTSTRKELAKLANNRTAQIFVF